MPTVLLIQGYRFYFWLNEHEPIHIHVTKSGKEARIVLIPAIDVTYCRGFKKNELHWPALDADLSLRGLLMSEVMKGIAA